MNMLSSLRSRIFLTTAMLAVLSIGVAIYLVSVRVTGELENSLNREILFARRLVEQWRSDRTRTFTTMARLVADTPKLKAAVDTNDPPTVQDNAVDYQQQLNSNLLLVTNKSGQVLATVGLSPSAALVVAGQPAVRSALAGQEGHALLPQPGGILQVVTVPIAVGATHPDILGALGVGFLLDDALADQVKQITGSEIAFGMDGRILASTLPPSTRQALASLLRATAGPQQVTLGFEEFVGAPLPLEPPGEAAAPGGGPVALILRSRTEQRRFLQAIHTELAVTAVVAVLLATLFSFAVARTITRPLAAITDVMREVAATGDLTRKIVLRGGQRWDDEDARLLATTFNTLTDSVGRFQREISQRERLSSLGHLSTVIAHEVRNPLMIIKAALHTFRRADAMPEAVREAAADIDEEVRRLNRIVNEVLDFARPIRFELAPLDLNALCREAAVAAEATPGAAVTLDLEVSAPTVTADAERLRIALVNLIVNARHAVDPSSGVVRVATRSTASGAAIIVGDNGVGIEGSDLARVFDPYFTTRRGGTGLGLPIAKNIVEGLGGVIAVTSEVGHGTEIRISLPGGGARTTSALFRHGRPA
ncbi:MAG: HAMP domain-containing protein [Luteitalea sp.]|nr:HAMP domain-containing protein [Luteitalea sp.]